MPHATYPKGGRVATLRRLMGALVLVLIPLAGYLSYRVYAYIVNWEPGSLESYQQWMTALIYILFFLTAAYILIATYERRKGL